jgi:hypothetical protein
MARHHDTGESDVSGPPHSWIARPVLAWTIRAGVVVVPLLASWLTVRYALRVVRRPEPFGYTLVWVAGAIGLSTLVYYTCRKALGRFSSLGVLYNLSLTFPDAAPSRLRAALGARRVEDLQRRMSGDGQNPPLEPRLRAKRLADLVAAVARHENLTRGHSDRVRSYSEMIGEEMGLDEEDLHKLRWAALLHDVGRLDVPSRILDKRGPLDDQERAAVEQHAVAAIGYLEPFGDWLGHWLLAATEHHERWDGTGYPARLAGEQISLGGRIVAVADAYDAMTSARSYQKSMTPTAARQELVDNAGGQFDPDVVRAFLNIGIRKTRAGMGPLAALIEIPAHLSSLAPAVSASAGIAAAGTVAVMASVIAPPVVSTSVELAPPSVERIVEEPTSTTSSVLESTTTTTEPRPTTTTIAASSTSTTTSTTTTTARRATTTTIAALSTTTTSTTTTSTTTTTPTYPTVGPPTTVPYPTVSP